MAPIASVNLPDTTTYARAYTFWLSSVKNGPNPPPPEKLALWFGSCSAEDRKKLDEECHEKFAASIEPLQPSNLSLPIPTTYAEESQEAEALGLSLVDQLSLSPAPTPNSRDSVEQALGLILILDQISRNAFRSNSKLAYQHFDIICRSSLRVLLSRNIRPDLHAEIRFSLPHRMWFYLPFMHSEYLEDHEQFATLFAEMRADIEPLGDNATKKFFDDFSLFEKKHVELLERFGRYPHRNASLGRSNSEDEDVFLREGGETFNSG